MAITNQEIAVLKKMVKKTRQKTDPLVIAKNHPGAHPKAQELIAAQNVLRDCISVVLNECMPIDDSFCAELAVRLASYAISVIPLQRQDQACRAVSEALHDAHFSRIRAGVSIPATWITDGVEHANVPEKKDVN